MLLSDGEAAWVGLAAERMPCFPFHPPYGAMVCDAVTPVPRGVIYDDPLKSIETRGRPWPFASGRWIAVYNTKHGSGMQAEARALPEAWPYQAPTPQRVTDIEMRTAEVLDAQWDAYERAIGPRCMIIGMAFIAGSRPLVPADLPRSFFYDPGRHAWLVTHAVRFAVPLSLADVGIATPPQSFAYADGAALRAALAVRST